MDIIGQEWSLLSFWDLSHPTLPFLKGSGFLPLRPILNLFGRQIQTSARVCSWPNCLQLLKTWTMGEKSGWLSHLTIYSLVICRMTPPQSLRINPWPRPRKALRFGNQTGFFCMFLCCLGGEDKPSWRLQVEENSQERHPRNCPSGYPCKVRWGTCGLSYKEHVLYLCL